MKNKLLTIFKKHYYILTGLLIFLSFPTYDVWFLKGFAFFAWFSLIPLFVYVRDKSFKIILMSSFIAGVTGHFLAFGWVGNFGAEVEGGYWVILAFLIPSLTVYFITKIALAEFFSRKFEKFRIFIYPAFWIVFDWLQSIGFIAFPWNYMGYSQFQFTSFIQVSSVVGIMGVTFIIVLVNKIIADYIFSLLKRGNIRGSIKTKEFKFAVAVIAFVLLIMVSGFLKVNYNKKICRKEIRLAIIQTCISPWESWRKNRFRYLSVLEHYSQESLKHDPDLIIWTESATLENISYHYETGELDEFERRVLDLARIYNKPILTGEIGVVEDIFNNRYYPQNNAVLIDKYGEVVDSYSKINLVPFGEWFPYQKWFPFLKDLLRSFGASNFVPGDRPILFQLKNRNFGVLICYEGIFYRLCREYRRMGAEFFVNITNYGWTDSYAGHIQPFAAARFRAIENGIWFVSAGNTGLTALIDPYGRTTSSIPILEKGYLVSDMDLRLDRKTFYSKFGDIFLYICMIFLFTLLIILFKNKLGAKKYTG